jgi:hypothetical protein
MRVTDLAMQLLYPSSGREQSDAIKTAALKPALFQNIHNEKREASDESIVNYLVSRLDFSPNGAAQAVASYRDAINFSGLANFGYNEQETPAMTEAQPMQTETKSASTLEPAFQIIAGAPRSWSWPLSVPRAVNAQLMITGQFNKNDLLRLAKQIEFIADSFDEEAE